MTSPDRHCGDTAALYSDSDSGYDEDDEATYQAKLRDGDLRNALAGRGAALNKLEKTVARLQQWAASTRSESDDRPLFQRLKVIWDAFADLDRRLVDETAKLHAGLAKFNAAVAKTPKPDKGEMVALRAELGKLLKDSDAVSVVVYTAKEDILARCAAEPVMRKLAEELRLAGRGHTVLYVERTTGLEGSHRAVAASCSGERTNQATSTEHRGGGTIAATIPVEGAAARHHAEPANHLDDVGSTIATVQPKPRARNAPRSTGHDVGQCVLAL
jgi:hypothetical protein